MEQQTSLQNIINGGNVPLNPSFLDAILILQMDCDKTSTSDDGDGAGIDNGVIEEDVLSPSALKIHEQWCYYKKKCLKDEFSGYSPLTPPINLNGGYGSNPYYQWGQDFSSNPYDFFQTINTYYGCVENDDFELIECISDKYDAFVAKYNLELSESDEKAIKLALKNDDGCEEGFEDKAWDKLCDIGFDYVTSKLSSCLKVDCIYEKLRELEDNKVCKIIRKLEENDYSIFLESEDLENYPGTDVSPIAETRLTSFGIELTITILFDNERACESDNPLIIAEALLHEFLHAEFYVELQELGWDGDEDNFSTILERVFRKSVKWERAYLHMKL